jgi:hypothetical protein
MLPKGSWARWLFLSACAAFTRIVRSGTDMLCELDRKPKRQLVGYLMQVGSRAWAACHDAPTVLVAVAIGITVPGP